MAPPARPATALRLALCLALLACGGDERAAPSSVAPAADTAEAPAPGATPAPGRRNVLLITIDTLRADALGAYGNPRDVSPYLDRLAERGVLFEQAHASSPNTLPSHASILTGEHPYAHGARTNAGHTLAASSVTLAERLSEAGYATAAEIAAIVMARRTGIDQGFAHFRDPRASDATVERVRLTPDSEPVSVGTRDAADISRRGIEFLREPRSGPFFLWLHYFDPHFPYQPPQPYAARFADEPYYGEVAHVDAEVGRVLEALETQRLADDTLVVVTSDHGEGLGEHGESTHTFFVWQTTMRIPLVLAGPGLPGDLRLEAPVRSIDIAPTVLDWLGLEPLEGVEGVSLLPAIRAARGPEALPVYGESVELQRLFGVSALRFLREGPWKYVHKPEPALYDLASDPGEGTNVAAEHPERVEALRERLGSLVAERARASEATRSPLDPETARQLESLGYAVGGSGDASRGAAGSLDLEGPDPTELVGDVRTWVEAQAWVEFGDPERALPLYEGLLERHPQSSTLIENLLDVQLGLGRAEDAIATLRRGVEVDPGYHRYWSNLGELLVKTGRAEEAVPVLRETLRRWPCDLDSRQRLSAHLHRTGARAAQVELLEAGVAACEDLPELRNELAWVLATSRDAALRDGARALALAEEAVAGLPDNPLVLDTLAAAYAESGRPGEARETLERALRLAREQRLPDAALRLLRAHAAELAAGRPIRE